MNLKKYMLLSLFTLLATLSCGKPEEPKDENMDEIQIEQSNSDTNSNNNQQVKQAPVNAQEPQETQTATVEIPQSGNNQPPSQVKPEEVKTSHTLQHVDKLIGKEIPMEDRILVFSKENNQYKITYKGESENGMQVDTKNLTFNEKNDSLTDGTYTFKLNKNKLGLYSGNQFIFTVD